MRVPCHDFKHAKIDFFLSLNKQRTFFLNKDGWLSELVRKALSPRPAKTRGRRRKPSALSKQYEKETFTIFCL